MHISLYWLHVKNHVRVYDDKITSGCGGEPLPLLLEEAGNEVEEGGEALPLLLEEAGNEAEEGGEALPGNAWEQGYRSDFIIMHTYMVLY